MTNLYLFDLQHNQDTHDGIFSFNLTLFIVIFQFILLMYILDLTFYKPLLFIKDQRSKYIKENIEKIKKIDSEVLELEYQYKKKIENIMLNKKIEFKRVKDIHKEIFRKEINIFKKDVNELFVNLMEELINRESNSHKKLNSLIRVLSNKMYAKLLV